jgi:N-acetylmuramoyl-L-alanine amidase
MSAWVEKFINVNGFARSGKKLSEVRKLVVHYTANPGASAENHYRYFNTLKDRYASAHIFVDKTQAINIIPLGEVAYHAGDIQRRNADGSAWRGVKELLPSANNLSIGVEMCIEKDGTFHPDTITRSEDVFVELCKKFNLDPLCDIVRHRDVTYKNCPAPWVKDESQFIQFKQRVNAKLNPVKEVSAKPTPVVATPVSNVKPQTTNTTAQVNGKVKTFQCWLNANYKTGLVEDNLYGNKTKVAALKALQSELNKQYHAGLKVDGVWGNLTKSAIRNVDKGDKGNIARILQGMLYCLKYEPNGFDGIVGNGCESAIKQFQKDRKLVSDGIAGKDTFEGIFK